MLSCKQLTEIATDYLEENLPWRVRLAVRMHLWICRHCRRYLEQMRKVITLLQQLPKEPVPPGLAEKLLPQFREARDRHA
jgi:predicted anti-sigma-YlaC factor YlaD